MMDGLEIKTIGDTRVLFVMAVDAEYGACLRRQFAPLFTGVGPVEAAVVVTRALAMLEAAGGLPDMVVSLGSAGSASLQKTQVYQASAVSYRDMDASPLGFARGATPFLDLPAVVDLPFAIPGVPEATLSTGANIISGAAYGDVPAEMVDMETFAVLRACHAFEVELVALRGISDGDQELGGVADWTEYLHLVDENLAHACDLLAAALSK
ncbi:5'-methylthioadenosine/S-adenosylhomocysteine nucleosidase [Vannielia sp.]|uniref:5'-methylthioadenosine/S-adenosylhomocysteine nucleosidase n=1 Tax=Vannielia sp. TaxID=2813045 RepID=UPI002610426A|nr:5'-methylthioadenosine/S-adenosylhomocysteine nucleosidase [Vannielia sp.]MDF1871687.1 5'-methylthioadenosine/S-adenosylhomocysteine nucleosidase [Vannielia sp.]